MARFPTRGGFDKDVSRLRHTLRADTIYGGVLRSPLDPRDTLYGGVMDTIYAGGLMDTLYGGVMDTIYAGGRVMDTVYGGDPWRPGGGGQMATVTVNPSQRVVTATVIDPATRKPRTVTYDRKLGTYLDTSLQRWIAAPMWMRGQVR